MTMEGAPEASATSRRTARTSTTTSSGRSSGTRASIRAPARSSREEAREQRIAGHVQRHRERGAQPPRRDRGLSRAEIVRAAIAVADAEGPEAISMRRIAREVGAGAMSLYWYVSSKEELLELMLDAIEAEIEVPEPSGDWRADLGTFAHRTRVALRQHRWAVEFIGTRPPSGPNDVRNLERLLSLLDGLGVEDVQLIMGIFMTVATFVIGAVIREAQEVRFQHEQERAEASLTPEEIQAEHERYRGLVRGLGRVPAHRPADEVRRRPGQPGHPRGALPVQPGLRAGRHRRPPGRQRRPHPRLTGWPNAFPRDTADVWWARRQDASAGHLALLDETERRRWTAYRRDADRERFLAGCVLAKAALARYAGLRPADVRFDRTCGECGEPHGKPAFKTFEHSVAHSGDLVAVAVAGNPVGVDVEQLDGRPHPLGGDGDPDALARLVLSPRRAGRSRPGPPGRPRPGLPGRLDQEGSRDQGDRRRPARRVQRGRRGRGRGTAPAGVVALPARPAGGDPARPGRGGRVRGGAGGPRPLRGGDGQGRLGAPGRTVA